MMVGWINFNTKDALQPHLLDTQNISLDQGLEQGKLILWHHISTFLLQGKLGWCWKTSQCSHLCKNGVFKLNSVLASDSMNLWFGFRNGEILSGKILESFILLFPTGGQWKQRVIFSYLNMKHMDKMCCSCSLC